jgi:hypothetical protein
MVQPSSSWRTVEGELAELTSDSLLGRQTAGGARSREPRALTFEAPHLVIEVEVVPAPAPAYSTSSSLRSGRDPGPPGRGDQDGRGDVNDRFQLEDLEARPISLRLHLPRAHGHHRDDSSLTGRAHWSHRRGLQRRPRQRQRRRGE